MTDTDEGFTTRQAAARLDISMERVRTAIRRGDLDAEKDSGGHWRISRESVRRFADELYHRRERKRRRGFRRK